MLRKCFWLNLLIVALPLAFLFGCENTGKVDQGRVVAFDKDKKQLTMIRDKKNDTLSSDYSYLPPLVYTLPADPAESGPPPKAGGRLKLASDKNQITIFDLKTQNIKTIDFKPVDKKTGVELQDPLVQGKKFPVVDREKKTVTIYSSRPKILETFELPDEYFALPDSTWEAGDEVRIYYKEDGKAMRFMNISQTNIFKK